MILMRLKNDHSLKLLDLANFSAQETKYEHGTSSLVLTGR
jgi:hypothetical protein